MRASLLSSGLGLAALAVVACSPRPAAPPGALAAEAGPPALPAADADAPAPGAAPTADAGVAAAPADAGPLPLPVSTAVAVVAGQELPLARDGDTVIDPAASFRLEVAAQITDGRLALHDERDAMVASAGTTELGSSRTLFRLAPEAPLTPGSAYTLQLDGAASREAHDPAGRAYAPIVLSVKTSGERPRPTVTKKRGRR